MTSSVSAPVMLEASNLSFLRNHEYIFGPLNFSIFCGETVLIEGANGAGKTTLLKVLAGLLEPSAGAVRYYGEPVAVARVTQRIALLGHLLGLKLDLSPRQNLRFSVGLGGTNAGLTPSHVLAKVGLEDYEEVPVRTLSAGQRKRVVLARLLLVPANIWLLDEPYANLDKSGIDLVNQLIHQHTDQGGAVVLTSHGAYVLTTGTPRRLLLSD